MSHTQLPHRRTVRHYDDGLRVTFETYPYGKLNYYYGTTDSVADRLHRAAYEKLWNDGNTQSETSHYQYNGVGRLVGLYTDNGQANVKREMFTGNDYDGFDRFGRTVKQAWKRKSSGTLLDQVDYTYDYAGNRTTRDVRVDLINGSYPDDRDQKYLYDGLQRLSSSDEGELDSGSITNRELLQSFVLDQLGNWAKFVESDDGGFLLYQERAHNEVNEIAGNSGDPIWKTTWGANWIDPAYDDAGNMTQGPKLGDESDQDGTGQRYTYDAWNRMVKVEERAYSGGTPGGWSTVQTNEYDGLGRRIVRVDTVASDTFDYYYNESWQVVNELKDGAQENIFHWHPYYIDALAVRWYDEDTNGELEENNDGAYYAIQDASFNVTAVVDDEGNVVERYQYSPYGEVTFLDSAFDSAAGPVSGNRHYYTGRERDAETGLQLNRHRFYAAHLGRWVNRDPIGYEGSKWNLYEYVASRPTVRVDAAGLQAAAPKPKPPKCASGADVGNVTKSRVLGVILFWARSPVPPDVPQKAVDAANAIGDALDIYDELPDEIKPPIGISPGVGDAGKNLADMAMDLYGAAAQRDGVRIWVQVVNKECVCERSGLWGLWGEKKYVWKEQEPIWLRCSEVGKNTKRILWRAFDLDAEQDLIKKAIPKSVVPNSACFI